MGSKLGCGGAEQPSSGRQVCPRWEQECRPDRQWITQGRLDSLLPAPRGADALDKPFLLCGDFCRTNISLSLVTGFGVRHCEGPSVPLGAAGLRAQPVLSAASRHCRETLRLSRNRKQFLKVLFVSLKNPGWHSGSCSGFHSKKFGAKCQNSERKLESWTISLCQGKHREEKNHTLLKKFT